MELKDIIHEYLAIAGGYGKPAALAAFRYSRADTERIFGELDEDYNISRFFHFRNDSGGSFFINGFPQSHVSIDAEIQSSL